MLLPSKGGADDGEPHRVGGEHCPSITAATRFKLVPGQENPLPGAPNYLAIYDIEADDLMTVRAELGSAVQAGKVVMSDTIRSEPRSTYLVYEQI